MVRRVEQLSVGRQLPPSESPIFFRAYIELLVVAQPNRVAFPAGHRIAGAEEKLAAEVQRGRETVVGEEIERVALVRLGRVVGRPGQNRIRLYFFATITGTSVDPTSSCLSHAQPGGDR